MKKQAKAKAIPKSKLKQGRFAAVLTLRVLPEDIPHLDALLKFTNKKTYTDALTTATTEIVRIDADLKDTRKKLQEANSKYENLLVMVSTHFNAGTSINEFLKKNAKDVKALVDRDDETEVCMVCGQYYIDHGDGCPRCDQ